jgi:threonine aldolase
MAHPIDLRSDTVTKPSAAMRRAMADAEVGDDQYGEDPTVNRLQERVAQLLGKDAAVFVPSGTMANQIALKIMTRPGDDVVLGHETHMVWHEAGAGGANSGVQFTQIGQGGLFTADQFRAAYHAAGHMMFPPTTLVAIENTHNRGGGVVFPQAEALAICDAAHGFGARAYLDGARLFNASVASGYSVAELARPFDVVSVALSKGLGCPVGSLIAGSKDDMARALALRKAIGEYDREKDDAAFRARPAPAPAAGVAATVRSLGRTSAEPMTAMAPSPKSLAPVHPPESSPPPPSPYLANTVQVEVGGTVSGGELLALDPAGAPELRPATVESDPRVVGIVAGEPGAAWTGTAPLAVAGTIVLCRVDASAGAIAPGDLLVTSATPGHAMRSGTAPAPGTIVGKALEPLAAGQALIRVLAMAR